MKWITSDTHFWHGNIIDYERKHLGPITAKTMNKLMIKNWNHVVASDDTIYHLGDFGFKNKDKNAEIVSQLNGYKILIIGNHDGTISGALDIGFDEAYTQKVYEDNMTKLIMSHIPMFTDIPILNVSVENWNYTPIPLPTTRFWLQVCGHSHGQWICREPRGEVHSFFQYEEDRENGRWSEATKQGEIHV